MAAKMTKLFHSLRDSNVTGEFLALLLFVSSRYTVWPIYMWLRKQWALLSQPPAFFWCICTLYFAFWVWLIMVLSRGDKRYPGMSMDALLAGSLLAAASALQDSDVRSDLAKKGFGAAGWVVFLSACALVVRTSFYASRRFVKADEPSINPD
jgi:hypothetical protein